MMVGAVGFHNYLPRYTLCNINYVLTICSLLPFTLKTILETFTTELYNLAFLSITFYLLFDAKLNKCGIQFCIA